MYIVSRSNSIVLGYYYQHDYGIGIMYVQVCIHEATDQANVQVALVTFLRAWTHTKLKPLLSIGKNCLGSSYDLYLHPWKLQHGPRIWWSPIGISSAGVHSEMPAVSFWEVYLKLNSLPVKKLENNPFPLEIVDINQGLRLCCPYSPWICTNWIYHKFMANLGKHSIPMSKYGLVVKLRGIYPGIPGDRRPDEDSAPCKWP